MFFNEELLLFTKGLVIWTPTDVLKWSGKTEDLCETLAEP